MKEYQILLALMLVLSVCQTSCLKSTQASNRRLSKAAVDPYRGAVKDLLQDRVGDFRLVHTADPDEMKDEVKNSADVVGAIYNSSTTNKTLQHMLISFASATEANKELDEALQRYKDAHVSFRLEDVKDGDGQVTGRRIVVDDLNTEAMNWTNGSLYCTAVSYTGNSSTFSKNLNY
jgi:hypothetical protein